jgi:hypothetical protein
LSDFLNIFKQQKIQTHFKWKIFRSPQGLQISGDSGTRKRLSKDLWPGHFVAFLQNFRYNRHIDNRKKGKKK